MHKNAKISIASNMQVYAAQNNMQVLQHKIICEYMHILQVYAICKYLQYISNYI